MVYCITVLFQQAREIFAHSLQSRAVDPALRTCCPSRLAQCQCSASAIDSRSLALKSAGFRRKLDNELAEAPTLELTESRIIRTSRHSLYVSATLPDS